MNFFIAINPPTVTAQEHKVRVDRLVDLRVAISQAIAAVLNEDERTIRRWHSRGLGRIMVPVKA